MGKIGLLIIWLLLCAAQCGCTAPAQQVQVAAANAIATLANAAGDQLQAEMTRQGVEAKAKTVTEADWIRERTRIEDQWRPVWDAFDAFAIAHATYTDQLKQGGIVAMSPKLRDRYCELRAVAITLVEVTLPDHPTEPCP